jgi:hypothetical protein
MIFKTLQSIEFWPLQLFSKHLRVHRNSNSQGGSSFGNVRVHSLALSFIHGLLFLARNLASPCLGCDPKTRFTTNHVPLGKNVLSCPESTHVFRE